MTPETTPETIARLRKLLAGIPPRDPVSGSRTLPTALILRAVNALPELLDELERKAMALETACLWLSRLAETYDNGDTEGGGKPAIEALKNADMDAYRAAINGQGKS